MNLPPRVQSTIARVAESYGVTVSCILGKSRIRPIAQARLEAARRLASLVMPSGETPSTTRIAGWLGYADHTGVVHALRDGPAKAAKKAKMRESYAKRLRAT